MIALILLFAVLLGGVMFITFHPVFGSNPSKETKTKFSSLTHYSNGTFVNQIPTEMATDFRSMLPVLKEFLKGNPNRQPKQAISIKPLQFSAQETDQTTKVTWFGHSSLLLEMDNKRILLDPMFGRAHHRSLGLATNVTAENCRLWLKSCLKSIWLFFRMIITITWIMAQ